MHNYKPKMSIYYSANKIKKNLLFELVTQLCSSVTCWTDDVNQEMEELRLKSKLCSVIISKKFFS